MKSTLIGKTIYIVIGHNIKSRGTIIYADDNIVAFCDYYKERIVKNRMDRIQFNYLLSEDVIRIKKVGINSTINEEAKNYNLNDYELIEKF